MCVCVVFEASTNANRKNLNFLEKEERARAKFFVCISESLRSAQILNFCSQMKFELFQLEIRRRRKKNTSLKGFNERRRRKIKGKQKKNLNRKTNSLNVAKIFL